MLKNGAFVYWFVWLPYKHIHILSLVKNYLKCCQRQYAVIFLVLYVLATASTKISLQRIELIALLQ